MSRRPRAFSDSELERNVVPGSLAGHVRSGVGWMMVGKWGSFAVQLGTTMILARLLTPEDYGLVGMVLALTVFVDQFRTMGLSQAVVQRDGLTVREVNALFYVNAFVGFALAAVVALAAPLVAAFYGQPELVPITVVLAITYALGGLAVQANALLTRQLNFRALAMRFSVARLLASAVAIAAAVAGAGYWSLVLQQVAMSMFALVLVWLVIDWRPGRPEGFRSAVPLVRFGAGVTLAGLFNTLSGMADNVLIGRLLGSADLGLYTRAAQLESMPTQQLKQPVNGTVTPLLSSLQDDPARYRSLYLKALGGLAMVALPMTAVLVVGAEEIVAVLLGDQWAAAAPILRWFALGGGVAVITSSVAWLYQSSGRGRAFATWSAAASVVILGGFVIGLHWGVVGVAAGGAIAEVLLAPLAIVYGVRGTPISAADVAASIVRPIAVAVAVLAGAWLIWATVAATFGPLLTLMAVGAGAVVVWAAMLAVWPSARREAMELVNLARGRRVPEPTTSAGAHA